MNIKQLFTNDDAVSPVIGVILMVAITVILAAVIGTFVLGLGDQVSDSAPQATIDFDFSAGSGGDYTNSDADDSITITHEGGDQLEQANIKLVLETGGEQTDLTDGNANIASGDGFSAQITAGSSATLDESVSSNELIQSGDEPRVVWTSSSGGDSATIARATVP